MVRLTLKRSLREASCCKVDVMKDGTGLRLFSRVTTDLTAYSFPANCAMSPWAAVSSGISIASSLRLMKRAASTGGFLTPRWASMVQYSRF